MFGRLLSNSDRARSGLVRLYYGLIFLSQNPQIYYFMFNAIPSLLFCVIPSTQTVYIRNKLNQLCYLFQISMYPELNEYISEVLKSVKTIIISNQMERISLLIMDSTLKPVEKLTFNKIHVNSFKSQRYLINLLCINSVIYIVGQLVQLNYNIKKMMKLSIVFEKYFKE